MPQSNARFTIISIFFTLLFTALGLRIIYLHTVKKNVIISSRRAFGKVKKLRGNIITSEGNIIASSIRGKRIFLRKGEHLTPGEKALLARMETDLQFPDASASRQLLIKFLSPSETEALRQNPVAKKLEFIPAQKRIYLDSPIYSPICGFTNYENAGAGGLEYGYNKELEGGQGEIIEIDATGKLLLSNDPDMLHAGGDSVKLTINGRLQEFLYRQIDLSVSRYRARSGYGIVMEPHTGKILAAVMAGPDAENLLKNPIISDAVEPGSTFKIVTVAAAIENGVVTPEDKFFCENGSFEFAGIKISDHDPYGWLTVSDIIKFSSNIGICKVGSLAGRNALYKAARDFGFGCPTGIKLPGEARGLLKRIDTWENTSLNYISFGQEIAATPLQIAQSFAVIANGGVLIKPCILESIIEASGKKVHKTKPVIIRRAITKKTSDTVKEMLFQVVEGGTGVNVRLQGWEICGKTGTAQKFDTKAGKYSEKTYFSSLGGFFPKQDPKFVIFIALDEPQEHYYGGVVCADAFRQTVKEIIDIYGIAPAAAAGSGEKKNET
ncbi:MAG: penicillin-binding protein 2 [Elusimicrobiota bacterium]|nr:penicillin-binding protein 2 [Elusimicrobiota bacterium]